MDPGRKRSLPAARAWADRVLAEHEQAERARHGTAVPDFWGQFSHRFVPSKDGDGGRDATADALLALVKPGDSVLDVGAGGGRIALPLAQKCRLVTAVEPSESMRERLREQVAEWGVKNLNVVAEKWEDARVRPADVVVCAHVLYTVPDPVPFVEKLDAHALRIVAAVMFEQPAVAAYFPLWPPVHGEDRLALPALGEFEALLKEMGIPYDRVRLPQREPRGFESVEQAVAESAARLFVSPGTPKAERLREAVKESLVPHAGGFRFTWARPQQPWLVTWTPTGAGPAGRRARRSRTAAARAGGRQT